MRMLPLGVWLFTSLFIVAEEDVEEVEDDDEGGDAVDPRDLELSIELTMLLGTNHLSLKNILKYDLKFIFYFSDDTFKETYYILLV